MSPTEKTIVVAGDAAIDWFQYPVEAEGAGPNWRLHPAVRAAALPGGAFLLADFLQQALKTDGVSAEVVSPRPPGELRVVPPAQVIHSSARLDFFRLSAEDEKKALRVRESLGFMGPDEGTSPLPLPKPNPDIADILVLDDAGNGFRDQPAAWPRVLAADGPLIVVHKMSRQQGDDGCSQLAGGPLWDKVTEHHADNHVVIVSAPDLRQVPGVDISRSLSWERTAKDLTFQIQRSEELALLRGCPYLVVLFETDGAILCRGQDNAQATLIFDPRLPEGGAAARFDGSMIGRTTVFTASLTSRLAKDGLSALEAGIHCGLAHARAFEEAGFALSEGALQYPAEQVFSSDTTAAGYESCRIEPPVNLQDSDPDFWRILDGKTRNTRQRIAETIVREGKPGGCRGVPVGQFGKLQTIDRAEIESYSGLRELIAEFLRNPHPPRPLCFAVFGPPGSGKSFGVKQVLASLNEADRKTLEPITFNISQYRAYDELIAAFHKVRDVSLRGKIPFVFFDEFDSSDSSGPLGWLKFFLAPMQDAEFNQAGVNHPLGKAIFVFAGGTRPRFEEFVQMREATEGNDNGDIGNPSDAQETAAARDRRERAFRAAKGPDFVSRLRGFINVMGPNRQTADDAAFIIRRAIVLRGLLSRTAKTKGLFDRQAGRLRIDDGVLRALLNVSRYRHGIRSMEALIDMSRLAEKDRFNLAALPPRDQLELHVDADEFLMLAQKERFQSLAFLTDADVLSGAEPRFKPTVPQNATLRSREEMLVEAAARLIHEHYARCRQLDPDGTTTPVPFDELPEEKRQSNRDAAADIPVKLRAINHGLRRIPSEANGRARTPDIADNEVDKLAQLEHRRWIGEQTLQGYVYGPEKIPGRKVSPYLVPFEKLPKEIQKYDFEAIYALPAVLQSLGYEVYRMEEADELDDPDLIDRLARAIHADYVANRKAEKETPETNPSLVDFDDLSDDLKTSNRDNARTVPRKLHRIGYGIRPVLRGETPQPLELTDEELDTLAMMEHARWNWERILSGWAYKPGEKNTDIKTTPYLVPWKDLSPKIQEYDLQTVRLIPALLAQAGYEAYRLGGGV